MIMKTRSLGLFVFLLAGILSVSLRAGATAPTYSVSVGSGSFSPNPICGGMTATAKLSATLNVQNPNSEIQESGDSWSWSASVTGYAASSQAAFGAVPGGTIVPVVNAPSGSATSTVTAAASQTTSPGYYQVTVSATDSFKLTDSSTSPATVTSQSKTGSTTLEITVVVLGSLQYYNPNAGYVAVPSVLNVSKGQSITFRATLIPSGASFPAGQPTWGGTSGASGNGSTITVTFSTTSSTTTDYKTVTATCGNTLTANVLVVQISAITASIASTPAVTLRSPTTGNKPARQFTTSQTSATWAAGASTSIVLIEGSTTVPLQATVLPSGFAPNWSVIRNPQDAPGLKQSPYPANDLSLSSQAGGSTNVSLNAVGSFSVVAYVDTFGSNKFDPSTETGIYFNIVSARVAYQQDASQMKQGNTHYYVSNGGFTINEAPSNGSFFSVSTGTISQKNPIQPASDAEFLNCKINITGGGTDGRLGLERVFTGWVNNISVNATAGNYQNSHTTRELVRNTDTPLTTLDYITQATHIPASITPPLKYNAPLLDASYDAFSNPPGGSGGGIILLNASSDSDPNYPATNLVLGQQRTVVTDDGPSDGTPLMHPMTGVDGLKQCILNYTFQAYLVVYTGTSIGAHDEPGASLYSVVEEVPWAVGVTYTLNIPGNGSSSSVVVSNSNYSSTPIIHSPTVTMDSVGGETYLPDDLDRIGVFDASH